MTLSTSSTRAVAQGNSASTTWPYTFLIPDEASLILTLVNASSGDETVVAPSLYTVTGIGDPAGGEVTYPLSGTPLTVATYIVVERFVEEVQETDLTNQGGAYPADIEDALDYLTMICQQLQDQADRSIVFSVADTVTSTLPVASARAGLFLAFDSNGAPIAVAGLANNVIVSAAMIPVVTAATTTDALIALGIGTPTFLDLIVPAGTLWDYTLTTAPSGFVFPYGQACTAAYPVYRAALVAAGSPYGTDGTDPLMPDLRSNAVAGKSNMGGVDNGVLPGGTVLGAALGVATNTLVTSNLPAYTPTGSLGGSITINDPGHTHDTDGVTFLALVGGPTYDNALGGGKSYLEPVISSALTGITADPSSITFTGVAQGGTSTALSNVQPTLVCNKILKVH